MSSEHNSLHQAGEREPTPADVVAELRMATIAIRLFGLDALPDVMRPASEPDQSEQRGA